MADIIKGGNLKKCNKKEDIRYLNVKYGFVIFISDLISIQSYATKNVSFWTNHCSVSNSGNDLHLVRSMNVT